MEGFDKIFSTFRKAQKSKQPNQTGHFLNKQPLVEKYQMMAHNCP